MDKIYTYPPHLKVSGIIMIVLPLLIWVLFGVITLADARTPITLFLYITLCMFVFCFVGLVVLRANSVKIMLSDDAVSFLKGRKKLVVPYVDIHTVSHSSGFVSVLVLHTDRGNFSVRKDLISYPDFAETLKAKAGTMQRDPGGELHIKCKAFEFYICAGIFIVLMSAIWIVVLVSVFTGEGGVFNAVLFSLVFVPFIAGLLYAVLRHPRQYDFTDDKIVETYLSGRVEFAVPEIVSVQYGQKKPKSYSRFGSPVLHFIRIDFAGIKKYVHIDQTATDFPIEDIAEFVKKNYP